MNFFLALLCCAQLLRSTAGQERVPQYALTASSSFRMIISRTDTELGSVALRILQETTIEHLFEHAVSLAAEKQQPHYRSMEVVVQGTELVPTGEKHTRLRFFVLASTQTGVGYDTQAERQASLNDLIHYSFATQDRIELMLLRIRVKEAENRQNINTKASVQLQAINVVALSTTPISSSTPAPAALPDNSTTNTGNGVDGTKNTLSTLDVVLIAVSSFILLGIIWMIFVHHMDRGHFENERMRALNLQHQRSQEQAMKQQREEEKTQLRDDLERKNSASQLTPTTHSTISGGSLPRDASAFPSLRSVSPSVDHTSYNISTAAVLGSTAVLHDRRPERPEQVHYVASGLTADRSYATSGGDASSFSQSSASTDPESSHVTLGIAEPFDQNWFRRPLTPGKSKCSSDNHSSSSGEKDDVFQVGVSKSDSQSTETDPQAMTEWLQSIHVIPESEKKKVPPSPAGKQPALEVASLGHVSLEQSMVSSAVASPNPHGSSALSL